jgi:hypothetical protein
VRARRTHGIALVVLLGAVASVIALAALAGCDGGKNEARSVVAVTGSTECMTISKKDHAQPGEDIFGVTYVSDEVYRCVNSMSDPRVSGTAEFKLRSTWVGENAAAGASKGTATLKNDEGTWRGTSQGAIAFYPSGENGNYIRTDFRGVGAFEGLRYVEIAVGSDQTLEVTGWVEPVK